MEDYESSGLACYVMDWKLEGVDKNTHAFASDFFVVQRFASDFFVVQSASPDTGGEVAQERQESDFMRMTQLSTAGYHTFALKEY